MTHMQHRPLWRWKVTSLCAMSLHKHVYMYTYMYIINCSRIWARTESWHTWRTCLHARTLRAHTHTHIYHWLFTYMSTHRVVTHTTHTRHTRHERQKCGMTHAPHSTRHMNESQNTHAHSTDKGDIQISHYKVPRIRACGSWDSRRAHVWHDSCATCHDVWNESRHTHAKKIVDIPILLDEYTRQEYGILGRWIRRCVSWLVSDMPR